MAKRKKLLKWASKKQKKWGNTELGKKLLGSKVVARLNKNK